ncbi:MAG: hypothetical protein HYW01_00695 [Deltaproteobacteria bacterium]|nr:hypothetical protein [Deltaproteobacteria bacterium]
MKNVLGILFAVLFLILFAGFASANLNLNGDVSSVDTNGKADLYCGLALPPEGEQSGQDQDTEQGQKDSPSPTPSPESKSNSQSDEEPSQN